MRYMHQFTLHATLEEVAHFHRLSSSMARITPPPIRTQMHHSPEVLSSGSQIQFTLWMGPIPIEWHALIENVEPTGFVDRQVEGPFASWVHRHIFVPKSPGWTTVIDVVEAELHPDLIKRLIGFSMWLGLPALFAYRAWKTQHVLYRRRARVSPTLAAETKSV